MNTPDTREAMRQPQQYTKEEEAKRNADMQPMNTPDTECGCTRTKYCTKHFNESVHRSHPTPDTEGSSVKEQVYNLVKEVHIQKPFEDVTGEPHYVTDQIMKIITSRDTYWKERVRKEVEGMRQSTVQHGHEDNDSRTCDMCGWNQALDTLLDNLK